MAEKAKFIQDAKDAVEAEKEKDTTSDATSGGAGGAAIVGVKRKKNVPAPTIAIKEAKKERVAELRAAVAEVQVIDPLTSAWSELEETLQVGDNAIMLAFLNVAGDSSILDASANSRERLVRVVTHIAGKLHARGTLAIPVESNRGINFGHIDGVMKEAGLLLGADLVTSVYLAKLAGHAPVESKLQYSSQMSHVLLAHKTADFQCHPVNTRVDAPRQSQLETVGLVLSSEHPSKTFLAPSMADHLLNRFTAAGDQVLVTAFEHNPLASLVLQGGRRLYALVGVPAKACVAESQINVALDRAMSGGWFGHLANADLSPNRSALVKVCLP